MMHYNDVTPLKLFLGLILVVAIGYVSYLIWDANQTPSETPSAAAGTAPATGTQPVGTPGPEPKSSGLSAGAIVGIVFGSLALIGLLVSAGVFGRRQIRRRGIEATEIENALVTRLGQLKTDQYINVNTLEDALTRKIVDFAPFRDLPALEQKELRKANKMIDRAAVRIRSAESRERQKAGGEVRDV